MPALFVSPLSRFGAPARKFWRADALAGLTVAVFAVPQAMAYAALAGLPPVNGLYAAIAMSIVAALWGSSPFVNTGPTNTASLLAAATLSPLISPSHSLLALAATFALLVGITRLLLGLFRLGHLVRFVPEPAFLGFISAADILIALGQLHQFFGVAAPTGHSTLQKLAQLGAQLPRADLGTMLIGLSVVAFLSLFDRFGKRLPVALGAMILATLLTPLVSRLSHHPIAIVSDIAPIAGVFPMPQLVWPGFDTLGQMLPGALAVALIGLIEAVSIAQAMALKKRASVDFDREFVGQGLAQIAGAFVGGMPGSGSFSRSALLERCGGQSALANVFFGVFTALALATVPTLLERIPLAALAGLLFFTGLKLLDLGAIKRVYRTSRADFAVLALTFGVTFFGKIEWGFFAGVIAAMAIFLAHASRLHLFEIVPRRAENLNSGRSSAARFEELVYGAAPHAPSNHAPSDVVALSLHGDLFFGLAPLLRARLGAIRREQSPRFVVIRTRRAHSIDYSCWKALFDFAEAFGESGGTLVLTGAREEWRDLIRSAGMEAVFPPDCVVARSAAAWDAFEEGLRRVAVKRRALGAGETPLSSAWSDYFASHHAEKPGGVSGGRDPFNDPATLGFAEM